MNQLTKELVELINENPTFPVITMVESEVVGDDSASRWYSSIGSCRVNEYVVYEKRYDNQPNVIYKEDIDEIIEDIMEQDESVTEEQAKAKAEALNWKKAIFLNVNLPDFD